MSGVAQQQLSQQDLTLQCRRLNCERRMRPTRALTTRGIIGRRKHVRRKDDTETTTDWFEAHVMLVAISIIIFCLLDFIFTAIIINNGGIELNLLMRESINLGLQNFFLIKYGVTCLSLILLVAHQNHRFFTLLKVKYILYGFALSYFVLMIYEINLLLDIFA